MKEVPRRLCVVACVTRGSQGPGELWLNTEVPARGGIGYNCSRGTKVEIRFVMEKQQFRVGQRFNRWLSVLSDEERWPLGLTPVRMFVIGLVIVNVVLKVENPHRAASILTNVLAAHAESIGSSSGVPSIAAEQTFAPPKRVIVRERRFRRKPLTQDGRELPFTCSAGDLFHKTEAPPGWDTFVCSGKNVWGLTTNGAKDR